VSIRPQTVTYERSPASMDLRTLEFEHSLTSPSEAGQSGRIRGKQCYMTVFSPATQSFCISDNLEFFLF